MNTMGSDWDIRIAPKLVRIILIINFLILLGLVGLGRSRELDLALRSAGIEDLIGRSMQVWIVGSTLFTTVLFARILWKKRISPGMSTTSVKVDGSLLVLWWLVLVGLMSYGFMLGMGG